MPLQGSHLATSAKATAFAEASAARLSFQQRRVKRSS